MSDSSKPAFFISVTLHQTYNEGIQGEVRLNPDHVAAVVDTGLSQVTYVSLAVPIALGRPEAPGDLRGGVHATRSLLVVTESAGEIERRALMSATLRARG